MGAIVLDERLQAIADLVRPGSVVADIGTDHGYLVCHLVATRKCPRAFACDIAAGPLSRARQNILRENLDARILMLQCNGLSKVPPHAVQDVVIAGMGGDLIAEIILSWDGCREGHLRYILQPMSKPEHLRRMLYREGFMLSEEIPVICGRFVYTVMVAEHIGTCVEVSPHFAYTGKLWERECDKAATAYFREVYHLCNKKAEGYAKSEREAHLAGEYIQLVERIREKIGEV